MESNIITIIAEDLDTYPEYIHNAIYYLLYTSGLTSELLKWPQSSEFIITGHINNVSSRLTAIFGFDHIVSTHAYRWTSLSPDNELNKYNNNGHFIKCGIFNKFAKILKNERTIYKPLAIDNRTVIANLEVRISIETDLIDDNIWIFTDGATKNATKPYAIASWGYVVLSKDVSTYKTDLILSNATNNRAELLAVYNALVWCSSINSQSKVTIVSDSMYTINAATKKNNAYTNQDIISDIHKLMTDNVSIVHVNAHQKAPPKTAQLEWFLWRGNDLANSICSIRLGRF